MHVAVERNQNGKKLSEWKKMGLSTLLEKLKNRSLKMERQVQIWSYMTKEQKTTKGPL